MNGLTSLSQAPSEEDILRLIQQFVEELPPQTAQLEISSLTLKGSRPPLEITRLEIDPFPRHETYPKFEVRPKNPRAAAFGGTVMWPMLYLGIGKGGGCELIAEGGWLVRGLSLEQELRLIWMAVIAGGFTEDRVCTVEGKCVRSSLKLNINGRIRGFGYSVLFQFPFRKRLKSSIRYEPYV